MKAFLAAFCLLVSLLGTASASPPSIVVILLPGTTLQDWRNADAPHLHRLMQAGAMALMNTRTAHRAGGHEKETGQSALLTLAAGSRAAGAPAARFAPASDLVPGTAYTAGALSERQTGLASERSSQVCLNWAAVVRANTDLSYDLRLGSLADTLIAHGVYVASGGGRDADWVAAGNSGEVRHLARLKARPGACVFWDAGPDIAAADGLIGTVAAEADCVVILSPYPSQAEYARMDRLTPLLLYGGATPTGLLYSPSTHRAGLVTNTDFAPSMAGYFGLARSRLQPLPFGFAWSAVASPHAALVLEQIRSQSIRQARGMRLLPYLAAALGVWLGAVTFLLRRQSLSPLWTLTPIAAFTAALFAGTAVSFAVILCGLLLLLLLRVVSPAAALILLTSGLTLVLAADMMTGDRLMHRSLLGYSALEGARYYGMGNEAMGLLLSAALVAAARLWGKGRLVHIALTAALAAVTALLGSAGAKAGGVLVSFAVFGTFAASVSGRHLSVKTVTPAAAVIAGGLLLAGLGSAFLLPAHSHIDEALGRIFSGGPDEAYDIIRRKLAVEGRLAYHSFWAALLWPGVLCLRTLWGRSPVSDPASTAFRRAGVAGIAACLLLNDAGVVAAAIFTVVLWSDAVTQKSLPALDFSKTGRL